MDKTANRIVFDDYHVLARKHQPRILFLMQIMTNNSTHTNRDRDRDRKKNKICISLNMKKASMPPCVFMIYSWSSVVFFSFYHGMDYRCSWPVRISITELSSEIFCPTVVCGFVIKLCTHLFIRRPIYPHLPEVYSTQSLQTQRTEQSTPHRIKYTALVKSQSIQLLVK